MASIGGRLAKVMYGSVVIAGIGEWSMSGFVPDIQEDTAFGEVSFSGNYDPADSTGQVALNALATVDDGLTNLYFYETTSAFWRVAAGGEIVLTKFNAVKLAKNALGTVEFAGKISAAAMERVV